MKKKAKRTRDSKSSKADKRNSEEEVQAVPDPEQANSHFLGVLPARDMKKNLGCG